MMGTGTGTAWRSARHAEAKAAHRQGKETRRDPPGLAEAAWPHDPSPGVDPAPCRELGGMGQALPSSPGLARSD